MMWPLISWMNLVFLTDTYSEEAPLVLLDWADRMGLNKTDHVTLFFFDLVVANMNNDDYFLNVMNMIDEADLVVACGENSIEQMQENKTRHIRMPDLTNPKVDETYFRSQLNTLRLVIDIQRKKQRQGRQK